MTVYLEKEIQDFDALLTFDYQAVIQLCAEEAVRYEACPYEAEISVVLTDNASIQALNAEFRNQDRPTDVLSFPAIAFQSPAVFDGIADDSSFNLETGELLLGDIMISVEKAAEQAKEYGHSLERELAFLVVHSMLHLFGYDHMEEEERLVMEDRQGRILDAVGITRDAGPLPD